MCKPSDPRALRASITRMTGALMTLSILGLANAAPAHHKVVSSVKRPVVNTAAAVAPAAAMGESLDLDAGKGKLLQLTEDAGSVFVVDPSIADVHVPSPRNVFVLGKKAGSTTLYVLGTNNKTLIQRTVVVARDMDALRNTLATRFPNMHLEITTTAGSLQVSGQAANSMEADAVVQSLAPFLTDKEILVNRMTIAQPLQVQLRVRITEVDRNVTQQLGINWQSLGNTATNFVGGIFSGRSIINSAAAVTTAAGTTSPIALPTTGNAYSIFGQFKAGGTNISALVDVLNQEGLITMLAEPNLVALSGETASFLAGGEFPIPVSQTNGAITVAFKQFGVKLDFTPTVMSGDRISLKVRPEVSQIDSTASVTTGGITIPGLSVRRADTTVELSSGQSFAIGGLLQATTTDTVSQIPGLGSIPILGKLFSSKSYLNNKTELVIMVTPYLVEPTNPGKLRSPLQSLTSPSNDVEYGFASRQLSSDMPAAVTPRLVGAAGYVY